MDRDRFDAELPAGAQNTQRNLAAIGDNNFFDHYSMMNNG
jgi:hypothetical protein